MTDLSRDLETVKTELGITEDFNADFRARLLNPENIGRHVEAKTYLMRLVTPDDFQKAHDSAQFDFDTLSKAFARICLDYLDPIVIGQGSYAIDFCSKIIYEIGPESRRVKATTGDKTWKFVFVYSAEVFHTKEQERKKRENSSYVMVPYQTDDPARKPARVRSCFVATFKASTTNPPQDVTIDNGRLILTVKQASLLAVHTLNCINKALVNNQPPARMLTPLAGAVFSKNDIEKLAAKLKKSQIEVLCTINSSCQAGGQYLHESRTEVAAVAAIVATRGIKDQNTKVSIINKTIRQFMAVKKHHEFDPIMFGIYAEHANGGVPQGCDAETLMMLLKTRQEAALRAIAMATDETETEVNNV